MKSLRPFSAESCLAFSIKAISYQGVIKPTKVAYSICFPNWLWEGCKKYVIYNNHGTKRSMTEMFAALLQHSTTSQLPCICVICCAEAVHTHCMCFLYCTLPSFTVSSWVIHVAPPKEQTYQAVRAGQISRDVSAGSVENPTLTAVTLQLLGISTCE